MKCRGPLDKRSFLPHWEKISSEMTIPVLRQQTVMLWRKKEEKIVERRERRREKRKEGERRVSSLDALFVYLYK